MGNVPFPYQAGDLIKRFEQHFDIFLIILLLISDRIDILCEISRALVVQKGRIGVDTAQKDHLRGLIPGLFAQFSARGLQ